VPTVPTVHVVGTDDHAQSTMLRRPAIKETSMADRSDRPSVLFVCVHNAGRSQMAAAYLRHLAGDRIEVRSAGTEPADRINPVVVRAMAEDGIDLGAERPKVLTGEAVAASDVVITMGCGDSCPYYPGTRYLDWPLPDPAGQGIDAVRGVRDRIRDRVTDLIGELLPETTR
jgi:protein-tyrosine-phosphatase